MGCATAYWLRQIDPSMHVAILEAEYLAYGASGRNAGFLLLGTHTDYASAVDATGREKAHRLWTFTAENARLIAELGGEAFDLQLTGSMVVAGSETEDERLRRSAGLLIEDGVDAEYLDANRTNKRLQSQGFYGSVAITGGGMLDPAKLVRHLATESGATVLEKWPAESLGNDGEFTRISSPAGEIRARHVVLTLNAFLPKLVPALANIVRPVRAQMLSTEPVELLLGHPVYSHEGFVYIRQRSDGRILLGGARHLHLEEEVGYEDATTATLQADLEAYLARHFPVVGTPKIERRWSGTMGFSPDSLPVVGRIPGPSSVHFAAGFTGHGMGFSVRFGQLIARAVLEEPDPAFDLFSASRLGIDAA